MINLWENRFLSRGGRLILLKSVLHSIPVYWASIAYIPKGNLTKIRKMCFFFLRTSSKKSEGIPRAKWKMIARPKEIGGWRIKNLDHFSKALATMTMWRCIQNPESLWGREILSKYFPGNSITEWMRSTEKTYKNGSIGWKEMTLAYPLIGQWIAWKIGNRSQV